MRLGTGKIIEIQQSADGRRQAVLQLEGIGRPDPGQYLQAHRLQDSGEAAGFTLFPGGIPVSAPEAHQFTTASSIPGSWQPGDVLSLRGPLGRGFQLPEGLRRLALCAFGPLSDHLLPLAGSVLAQDGEVALFTDGDFSPLPARIEVNRLSDLPDACKWADLMACSVPLEGFSAAAERLDQLAPAACPTQILTYAQFPCAAMAACGVCALYVKTGQSRLACQDGPVFDWRRGA